MPFPSVLSTFNQPTPTSRLNSPSHSALHNTVSSAVGQLEAVIGVEGTNSVVGTLEYFIKSPDSNGGGHVQQANVGGTGQTTFTKGDLLVATSSSVIAKLGASPTAGNVLVIDPNQSTGMKWGAVVANKIFVSTSSVAIVQSSNLAVLFASSILGSTLGTSNAIRFTGGLQQIGQGNSDSFNLVVNYGNNIISSITFVNANSVAGVPGKIEGMIVGNGNPSSQLGYINLFARTTGNNDTTTPAVETFYGTTYGNSSVNSSADQNLVITGKYNTNNGRNCILSGFFVVEKIV